MLDRTWTVPTLAPTGSPCRSKLLHFAVKEFLAFLYQGFQGLFHNKLYQAPIRVVAAAISAGGGIGADGDVSILLAHRLMFQQPFIDRTQLLHRHVPVIDIVNAIASVKVAQSMDNRRLARHQESWLEAAKVWFHRQKGPHCREAVQCCDLLCQ